MPLRKQGRTLCDVAYVGTSLEAQGNVEAAVSLAEAFGKWLAELWRWTVQLC